MAHPLMTAAVVAATLAVTGCAATADRQGTAPSDAPSAQQPVGQPHGGAGSTTPGGAVTKVLVVVVENHSLGQMTTSMPYTASLASRYGYASDYHGVTYPSLPNYLAIASGSTHGVRDDLSPSKHPIDGSSVFGAALAAGSTATLYADGMPGTCAPTPGGDRYVVKHNPWAYFTHESDRCATHDVPAERLDADVAGGRLPVVGMLVPNMCHDAHDCDLSVADGWIHDRMRTILAGPDWASGHLAVVLTADTDDRHDGNRVLTVVVHPSLHGAAATERLDHYALSRLLSEVSHTAPLGDARSAPSMARAFGLPIG